VRGEYDFSQTDSFHFGDSVEFVFVLAHPARPIPACPHHPPEPRSGRCPICTETHGDPSLTRRRGGNAELNLPIRQGYVLATDKGRVEVEFENGAMAFLKENTVLEFMTSRSMTAPRTTPRPPSGQRFLSM